MFHAALATLEELLSDARIDEISPDLCEAELNPSHVACGRHRRLFRDVAIRRGLGPGLGLQIAIALLHRLPDHQDTENLVAVLLDKTDVGGGSSKATSPQQVHRLPREHLHS